MAFLAVAAPILSAVSAVAGAAGTVLAGVAAKNAGDYQAKVAQMNAQIARDNADRAVAASQIKEQDNDMLVRAQLGTQEALQGASGVLVTGGSQILTRKAAAELGRRDTLNIRNAGEVEAYNYKVQAANQVAEASAQKAKGQGALIGSFLSAGGSLLSSASSIADPSRFGPRKASA